MNKKKLMVSDSIFLSQMRNQEVATLSFAVGHNFKRRNRQSKFTTLRNEVETLFDKKNTLQRFFVVDVVLKSLMVYVSYWHLLQTWGGIFWLLVRFGN